MLKSIQFFRPGPVALRGLAQVFQTPRRKDREKRAPSPGRQIDLRLDAAVPVYKVSSRQPSAGARPAVRSLPPGTWLHSPWSVAVRRCGSSESRMHRSQHRPRYIYKNIPALASHHIIEMPPVGTAAKRVGTSLSTDVCEAAVSLLL